MNKKVLIILDMLNAYIYDSKPLIPIETRETIITNIKKVIALARKKGVPIIYIKTGLKKTDPIYKLINYRTQAMEGTKEAEIIDELKPKKKDYILTKRGYDGFWKSGLEKLLIKLKNKEIFLTGCQTDCCVRETAVTAAHLGYDVYVLEDCCQTSREFGQIAALRFLRNCTRGIINSTDLNW